MRQVQAPKILSDLYRDLRDRRLLLPAAGLLVAIVAVPVLLASSTPTAVPPAASPVPEDATAVESAVLADEAGVRDYRERLSALTEKNPFEQKFALPEPASDASGGASDTVTGDSTTAGSSTSGSGLDTIAEGAGSAVSETVGSDTVDETTVSETTVDETTVNEGGSQPAQPKPEVRFYAGRVDVLAGPRGRAKTLEDVRPLDFLPNDKAPVAAFIGLAAGGDRAVFSLSRDVTETSGEGACAPKKPNPCEFLTLRVGEERTLTYGPDGTAYRLKLLDVHVVRVPDPREQHGGDQSDADAG